MRLPVVPAPPALGGAAARLRDEEVGRRLNTSVIKRQTYTDVQDIDPVHARWQKEIEASVPGDLPSSRAIAELPVDGHRIDLVIDHERLRVFVELKTDDSARRVIRSGLAQLVEYAFWPHQTRCHALILTGPAPANNVDQAFPSALRTRFQIPVYYLQFGDGRLVGLAGLWPELVAAHGKTPINGGAR